MLCLQPVAKRLVQLRGRSCQAGAVARRPSGRWQRAVGWKGLHRRWSPAGAPHRPLARAAGTLFEAQRPNLALERGVCAFAGLRGKSLQEAPRLTSEPPRPAAFRARLRHPRFAARSSPSVAQAPHPPPPGKGTWSGFLREAPTAAPTTARSTSSSCGLPWGPAVPAEHPKSLVGCGAQGSCLP